MALTGSIPAKIRPDIIPGRLTSPIVLAESIVGDIPVRILSRIMAIDACLAVAPKASRSKTGCRSSLNCASKLAVTQANGDHRVGSNHPSNWNNLRWNKLNHPR